MHALGQILLDVGLPTILVVEITGCLRSPHTLLGTIFGWMFPSLLDCRMAYELHLALLHFRAAGVGG
jgi:hypothetical protein